MSALSRQATDLRSPNLHRGCIWQGCNNCLEFDLLFGVKGVTMHKKHFGTTRVAQIVTVAYRDLQSCVRTGATVIGHQ